ncbi:unnamed protein product, partial [Mesorhabditis spiculigera]
MHIRPEGSKELIANQNAIRIAESFAVIDARAENGIEVGFEDFEKEVRATVNELQYLEPGSSVRVDPDDRRKLISTIVALYQLKCVPALTREGAPPFQGDPNELAYRISTSGTTSASKIVDVTWPSILANVSDFGHRFGIDSSDRVLFSTSIYFDPSIIEIFLPLQYGCRLIVASESVRSSTEEFLRLLRGQKPTVIQVTPAVLTLLGQPVLEEIFRQGTSVRIMLVGGAAFPLQLFQPYIQRNERVRVFNVYGITEVSCWASIQEIDSRTTEITIGDPIFRTGFALGHDGELLITGERKCYIDGVRSIAPVRTGDLALKTKSGAYTVVGRKDDQLKINGVKFHPARIAEKIVSSGFARNAQILTYKENFLILFVDGAGQNTTDLEAIFPAFLKPAKIFLLKAFPLNSNGKIDKEELMRIIDRYYNENDLIGRFWECCSRFGIHRDSDLSRSFQHYGVDSQGAMKLAFELSLSHLIASILAPSKSIFDFLEMLQGMVKDKNTSREAPAEAVHLDARCEWEHHFEKCIDGDPKIVDSNGETLIFCASHAGVVKCLKTSGEVAWSHALGQRIETSLTICGKFVVAGSHSGSVHFFRIPNGESHWTFETGDQIRTEPALDQTDGSIYVYSYNKKLFKLDSTAKTMLWMAENIGLCPGRPLVLQQFVLLGTLDRKVLFLDKNCGAITQEYEVDSPVFAPISSHATQAYVCTVNGTIYAYNTERMEQVSKLELGTRIFAPVIVANSENLFISTEDGRVIRCAWDSAKMGLSRRDEVRVDGSRFVKGISRIEHFGAAALLVWQLDDKGRLHKIEFDETPQPTAVFALADGAETFGQICWIDEGRFLIGARDDYLRMYRL